MSNTDSEGIIEQNNPVPVDHQPPQWERPARYTAAVFLVIGAALLLLGLVPVADIVALGFIIALLMYLPIRSLARRTSLHFSLAVVLLYLLLVVIICLALVAGFSHFADGAEQLSAALKEASASLETPNDTLTRKLVNVQTDVAVGLAEALVSVVSSLFGLTGLLVASLFFSILLLLALGKARGVLADWVPARYQRETELLLTKLDRIWVGYIAAQVIYGATLALLSFIQYYLMGVPSPFVLAILTGIISLIPTIGGLLASLVVAVPCLLLGSTVLVDMSNGGFALLVLLVSVVITQVTYNFIALPIVGKFVNLPTAVVFVGVLAGLALGSVALAFLVVPILSTLRVAGSYVLSKVMQREPFPGETVPKSPDQGFFSQLLISRPVPPE